MGTNYYLIKKCSKEELSKYGHYNDDFRSDIEPKKLTNGFLYRNTYYPTEEELLKNLALILHIGKSSYGWHFSLCIYPELGINDLEDWKKLFSEYEIYDFKVKQHEKDGDVEITIEDKDKTTTYKSTIEATSDNTK